jgi:hypothetical protein
LKIYTGEDLKWDTPLRMRGVISNHYRYRAIGELKWDILILQWCKMARLYGFFIEKNIKNMKYRIYHS